MTWDFRGDLRAFTPACSLNPYAPCILWHFPLEKRETGGAFNQEACNVGLLCSKMGECNATSVFFVDALSCV